VSIKQRLLLWLLVPLLGLSVVFIGGTYAVERAAIEHYQDLRLRQIATGIPPRLKTADFRAINVKLFHGRDDFLLQVWTGDREIYRSTIDRGLPRFTQPGFGIRSIGGERWKVYLRHAGPYTIQVGQSLEERSALARERALHLVAPLILLIVVIALFTPLAVTAGLRTLHRISRELDARHIDRLNPLDPTGEPAEIQPLVQAINTLLNRLGRAAGAQQRFLADASHELRTPLAGLQLQVQMVEQAGSDAERRNGLEALKASVKRTGRLVEQLLATSRLDAEGSVASRGLVTINTIVREALVRLDPLAQAKRIDIGLVHDDEAVVPGDGDELMLLVLNLIDNAIRYTPVGGQVDVALWRGNGTFDLTVEDSGPGIPQAERTRAFDRFFRGAGHTVAGSGLGLAIAKRIADRHAAAITLEDAASLGGLCVRVRFPQDRPSTRPQFADPEQNRLA